MSLLAALSLPLLALASPLTDDVAVNARQQPTVNGTVEYATTCKKCPYLLCANIEAPWYDEVLTFTCYTEGELIDDNDLWLKTTSNCYVAEYDLIEYAGDYTQELEYCGEVELDITEQDATVRYLSEGKWGYDTSSESLEYYGRDEDVTLTCWTDGADVNGNGYWYKTTDNCHISGSGLWEQPDHSELDNCGPEPGPRPNETRRGLEVDERDIKTKESGELNRRWLQPEIIGEEYAPCYTCPTPDTNSTCYVKKTYEFNDTVVSQCLSSQDYVYPNGSTAYFHWMLTTDWCYVEGFFFWVPPWDNYRYPRCEYWSPDDFWTDD
jgi:hypothetical protein